MEKETRDIIEMQTMISFYTEGYDINFISYMIDKLGNENRDFKVGDTIVRVRFSENCSYLFMKKSEHDSLSIERYSSKTIYTRELDGEVFKLTIESQDNKSFKYSSTSVQKGVKLENKPC